MRRILGKAACIVVLATVTVAAAQRDRTTPRREASERYGIRLDLERYPQDSPHATVQSIVKAARLGELPYLIAQLVAPLQVDAKLRKDRRALAALVARATPERTQRLIDAMRAHLKQGQWAATRRTAVSHAQDLPTLRLRKVGQRWYLSNTIRPVSGRTARR